MNQDFAAKKSNICLKKKFVLFFENLQEYFSQFSFKGCHHSELLAIRTGRSSLSSFVPFFFRQRDPDATTAATVVDLKGAETFFKVSQMKSSLIPSRFVHPCPILAFLCFV